MSIIFKPIYNLLTSKNKETPATPNKQIIFASFHSRFMSMMIDLLVITIFFTPLISIISEFLIKDDAFNLFLKEFSAELTNHYQTNKPSFSQAMNHPKLFTMMKEFKILYYIAVSLAVNLLFISTYFISFYYCKQATLGQMMMSIKISTNKMTKPTIFQLFIRSFACLISTFMCFLGFLIIPFNSKKIAFHDYVAKTIIIKK